MKNKITILDKKTINQIAAGEVVERPASVVKELVENSIDAQSTKIVIELEATGRKLIRITDNGIGIAPDDMKLAFEKHSTSKILNIMDIYKLSTMGFRGEALASIAAVSRIECISSDGKTETGRKITLEGGKVRSFEEYGGALGTMVKVKDLFYNIPARYKYLKTDQTELAHILDVITHLALYHHKISFKLIHNGNELLNLPAMKNQVDNLVNIYGKELVRNLVPISTKNDLVTKDEPEAIENQEGQTTNKHVTETETQMDACISGYIGKPSITRSDSSCQSIFINGRYVENKYINSAIKDAYRTLVMKNRYPFVILYIDIDPSLIDVNISPTKLQVRFENEERIYKNVLKTLQNTLRTHDLIPEVKFKPKPQPVSLKAITTFGVGKPGYPSSIPVSSKASIRDKQTMEARMSKLGQRQSFLKSNIQELVSDGLDEQAQVMATDAYLNKQVVDVIMPPKNGHRSTLPAIQPIGQLLDTYIIAQAGDNLLIIDQHAAHERIMYEKIKQRYNSMSMSTQEMLEPVELELTPKEQGLLKTSLETLEELNFVIDELGENSFYVKGIPIILGRLQNPEFIHDIINDLIYITKEKEREIIKDKMLQLMACKAAIKAGKTLSMPEIMQLLRELYSIEDPYTCAHGRPTIISMTENQLEKSFKRIV